MDIIVIESSFDDRLILTVRDDVLSKRCESIRNDIHNRVHPKACRTSYTYSKMCIFHSEKYRKNQEKIKHKKTRTLNAGKEGMNQEGGLGSGGYSLLFGFIDYKIIKNTNRRDLKK